MSRGTSFTSGAFFNKKAIYTCVCLTEKRGVRQPTNTAYQ